MASRADTTRTIQVSSSGEATVPQGMSRRALKKEEKRLAAQPQSSSNDAALEAIRLEKNRLRNERIRYWIPTFAFGFFVMVAIFTTTLVEADNSKSLIFLIPFFFFLLAAVVGFLDRNAGHPLKRIILSLVVGIILLFGFLLLTTIPFVVNFAVDLFAFFAGNATLGTPGIANAIAGWLGGLGLVGPPLQVIVLIVGLVINFLIIVLLPGLLLSLIFQEIVNNAEPSVKETLIMVVLTLFAFLFPIGLSVIGNLGL